VTPPEQLVALRRVIDDIDADLVQLLARRFEATNEVGVLKARYGLPAADPAREQEQRERLSAMAADNGLSASVVLGVFREIVSEVVRNHERFAASARPPAPSA